MRLQTCVGSVCVGGTTLMCRGRECTRLGSATRLIFFYVSLVGGGLRPSGFSTGRSGSVRVFYYESRKRELKIRLMNEGRCDERLKARVEESTCLTYTGLHDKTN